MIGNPCDAERVLLAHALRTSGLEVLEASCAKEVVEIALSQPVDLVLLDSLNWENPSMATLSILKHHARTCSTPVVLFGQPQNKEQVAEAVAKGAAAWLGRQGFVLTRFVERLRTLIEEALQNPAPRGTAPAAQMPIAGTADGIEPLTSELVMETLTASGAMPAFEFNLVEGMTAGATKRGGDEALASVLDRDPILTLAVLSAAGKRASTAPSELTDVRAALPLLGSPTAYRVLEAVPPARTNTMSLWDPGCWWAHSVATSRIASLLSRRLGLGAPNAAANAGLLHELGYFVLANYFPKHYGTLFSAACESDSVQPQWEKNLIGAYHGEIAEWVLRGSGLTGACCDAVRAHHALVPLGHTPTASSRVMAMVLQAADLLADALLPADPPLTPIANLSEEFEAAFTRSGVSSQSIVDSARKIMAELLTEMSYHFPQSTTRSFFYRREPLNRVAYFAPGGCSLDLVKLFLHVRSRELLTLDRASLRTLPPDTMVLINLSHLHETAAQLEAITSLMAARLLDRAPGCILLPAALPDRLSQNLVPPTWRIFSMPVHALRLVRWMSQQWAEDANAKLSVA